MMAKIKRPVFMCGENPGLRLYVPETEQRVAVASYWHCTYSPWGRGNALVLWLDEQALPEGLSWRSGGIFTDNVSLAHELVGTLTQYFQEFQGLPVTELPYLDATCEHVFDGMRYSLRCRAESVRVEIIWEELLDQKRLDWPQFPAGPVVYDLTTVICPCRAGYIEVNGLSVPGEVQVGQAADGHPSSSAFLAFAESWVGPRRS